MTHEMMWNVLRHELQDCIGTTKRAAESSEVTLRADWKSVVSTLKYVVDSMDLIEGKQRDSVRPTLEELGYEKGVAPDGRQGMLTYRKSGCILAIDKQGKKVMKMTSFYEPNFFDYDELRAVLAMLEANE